MKQGRPTAAIRRVDVSASDNRPSAAPANSEERLFRGYTSPRYRYELCACGQEIRAEVGWEAAAVDEHNAGPTHAAWRRARGDWNP